MVDIVNSGTIQAPSSGVSQGLTEESSTQQGAIGALRETHDGRRFRYGYFAAACNRAVLVSPDYATSSLAETATPIVATAEVGDTAFQITLASKTAGQFAGAYLHMTDHAGEGYQYRIVSSSATGATTSGKVDLVIEDPGIIVEATTATDIAISGYPYHHLKISDWSEGHIASGVTVRDMTAEYYGWVQTSGIATVLADGVITKGSPCSLSDGVDGAVELRHDEIAQIIGTVMFESDNTSHVGVRLTGLE
jgi:hypothetical protein